MLNKSFLTTLVSILLIGVSYISPQYVTEIRAIGFYSFSGAITNWLAIHMLFEKVPFLYGSGIVTQRFQEFRDGIENLVMKQFFNTENINRFLGSSSQNFKLNTQGILEVIDFDKIFVKLKAAIMESSFGGMLGMFGGEEVLNPLKEKFTLKFKESIEEILNDQKVLSKVMSTQGDSTAFSSQISEIVKKRLEELTPDMVKQIIQDMIKEHLGWLVVWGGVFGGLIGLISTFI